MSKGKPVFSYDKCMACHMCEQVCAFSSIDLTKEGVNRTYKKVYPELVNADSCTGCKQCEKVCPVNAIVVQ